MQKFTILGITLYDCPAREALRNTDRFLGSGGLNTAAYISSAQIAQAFGVSFVSLLCGCVTEVPTVRKLSEGDAHAVSRTVEAIASGCTPRAQQLMVALCQEVARSDKHASRE